jgi:phytoene synthase
MPVTSRDDHQSVFERVRTHDPDRYLTALMAPRRVRGDLMALYAFNTELARIPPLVSEPALGEIRLQWWRDSVDQMGTVEPSGAPVAAALGRAVAAHDLPIPLLIGMVDARSADLDGGGFPDLEALKAYLYKSDGAIFSLSAHILGIDDAGANRAANAAGFACGLTNLIRLLARDIAAGRIMLPLSMLNAHGIQLEQILAGTCSDELKPVLAELASEARAARDTARQQIAKLDPGARSVFAPLALVESYLKTLERPDHNALEHIAGINPLTRFWRLWRAS